MKLEVVTQSGKLYIGQANEITPVIVEPPPTQIPLPTGNFKQIRHDYESNDGLIRIGMPAVLSLSLNQYSDLTEDWQWFWFRQLVHAYTNYAHWDETKLTTIELDMLKGKWRSLTKKSEAFTNFKGTDNCKDYITPNNLTNTAGQEPLVCTGNIVKIIGSDVRIAKKIVIPIETLDGNKPPPPISKVNRLNRPDLILAATNVAADKTDPKNWTNVFLPDGTFRIDPFPQLGSKDTPFPLRTNGKDAVRLLKDTPIRPAGIYQRDGINYAINYIRVDRLKSFTGTFVPRPYNP